MAYAEQGGVAAYDVLMRSAKIYQKLDPERAKMLLDSAVNNYPEAPEGHFQIALIYYDKSDYKPMMEHIQKFQDIYSRAKASGDKKLIKACENNKMPEQTRNLRLSAFTKTYQDGVSQLKLADSLAKESRNQPDSTTRVEQEKLVGQLFDKASGLFDECLLLDDTISGVYANMALLENRKGNAQGALERYRQAYKLAPEDAQLHFSLATTYFGLQQYDSAAAYYGAFADRDSLNREGALINQAMCYQAMNAPERMKATLDKILAVTQQNGDVFFQRGMYYIRQANSQAMTDSARVLDSLSSARPNDNAIDKARADLLAYRISQYKLALPDFKAAAELAKTDTDYWYWYGTSAMLSDATSDARTAYEKCIGVNSENKDCWCQLAIVYAKLKMQKEFDEATAKCPKQ